jgi:hypothetical protein
MFILPLIENSSQSSRVAYIKPGIVRKCFNSLARCPSIRILVLGRAPTPELSS